MNIDVKRRETWDGSSFPRQKMHLSLSDVVALHEKTKKSKYSTVMCLRLPEANINRNERKIGGHYEDIPFLP